MFSDALYIYRFSDDNEDSFADDAPELRRYINGKWEIPVFERNQSTAAQQRWYVIDKPIREAQARQDELDKIREAREEQQRIKQESKTNKVPLILSPRCELNSGGYQSLLTYLRRDGYTLHLACKPEYENVGRDEYRKWTNGEEISDEHVKIYDNAFSREWFLIFQYSPDVSFPFPIVERGTGGGRGSPCGLHLRGRVEVCYAEVVEQLIRAGLRAA